MLDIPAFIEKSIPKIARIASQMVSIWFYTRNKGQYECNGVLLNSLHTAVDPEEVKMEANGRVNPRSSIALMQMRAPASM